MTGTYKISCYLYKLGDSRLSPVQIIPVIFLLASLVICKPAFSAQNIPLSFDDWSVTSGNISAGCAIGATCTLIAQENGFLMRKISDLSGSYFQYIHTDVGVTGNPAAVPFTAARGNIMFSNEHMVPLNPMPTNKWITGLASKTTIVDSTFVDANTENRFVYDAVTLMGWAVDAIDHPRTNSITYPFNINAYNKISSVDYSGESPLEVFTSIADINVYRPYVEAAKSSIAMDKTFEQYVDIGGQGQIFKQRTISGYLQTDDRALDSVSPLLPGGTNGGDVAWGALNDLNTSFAKIDEITAQWIGQSPSSESKYSYNRYHVMTAGVSPPTLLGETSLTTIDSAEPVYWHPTFGAAPSMNVSHVVAPTANVPPPDLPMATMAATTPLVGNGTAGPPLNYSEWTVTAGDINLDVSCPLSADSCGVANIAAGFMQREITVAGEQYIQTIITEETATGNPRLAAFDVGRLEYASENFVKVGGSTSGIAARTSFVSIDDIDGFYNRTAQTALVNSGWAQGGAADPVLTLDQSYRSELNLTHFKSDIHLKVAQDGSKDLYMFYQVPGSFSNNPVSWATHIIEGGFQNTARVAGSGARLLASGTNGGDINWDPGQAIRVTWNGATYDTYDSLNGSLQSVYTMAYTNLVTGETTSTSRFINGDSMPQIPVPNPESWVSPFAYKPSWMQPVLFP